MMYYHGDFLNGLIHMLWVLLIIVLIVRVLFWRRRPWNGNHGQRRNGYGYGRSAAEDLLAERFAKGEITKEEYEDRVTTIKKNNSW